MCLVFIVDTSGLATKRLLQNECAKWPKAHKALLFEFPAAKSAGMRLDFSQKSHGCDKHASPSLFFVTIKVYPFSNRLLKGRKCMCKTYWIFNNCLSTEHLETIHLLMIHQWPTFPLNPVFSLADRQMLSATYPLGHDIDLFLNFVCASSSISRIISSLMFPSKFFSSKNKWSQSLGKMHPRQIYQRRDRSKES